MCACCFVRSRPSPKTKHFHDFMTTLPSMEGKTVAITGCTSGTGLVLAKACGSLGARIVMLNRHSERAEQALEDVKKKGAKDAILLPCDLMSFAGVHMAAAKLKETCPEGIDVLCNNAGVMALPDAATVDGCDVQMQTNHLSHFLLTSEVWGLLELAADARGEARVVNHSSGARNKPKKPMTAEFLGKSGGRLGGDGFPGLQKWRRYQQSKLANLLFTYALADWAAKKNSKVKALCAHPGPTDSGLQGKVGQHGGGTGCLDNLLLNVTLNEAQSVEDGSMGILRCCCDGAVQAGQFYGPAGRTGPAVLLPEERDEAGQTMLWAASMETCSISEFGEQRV